MRRLRHAIAAAAAAACSALAAPEPAQPRAFAPAEIPRLAAGLSADLRLGITGLAFVGDVLYAGTNLGWLEVRDAKVEAIHRWGDRYSVIGYPAQDAPRGAAWATVNGAFVRRTAAGWERVEIPKAPGRYYTRGDVLAGFRGVADPDHFRIVGGGAIWRREAGEWVREAAPPREGLVQLIDAPMAGGRRMYLTGQAPCASSMGCRYFAHWGEASGWGLPVALPALGTFVYVASTGSAIYARGEHGMLYRLEPGGAVKIATPAPCEAIAATTSGKLLASFRDAGIHALDGTSWIKLFDAPYAPFEGEHWAYLAELDGRVAFATGSQRRLRSAGKGKEPLALVTGRDALWVSRGRELVHVPFDTR